VDVDLDLRVVARDFTLRFMSIEKTFG
jgi:hypothetical protein